MNREELLEELTGDVLTYVMHGSFPERHFANEIKPTGLDERFDDYEMLVRLHFVLRPRLVAFVEELPQHLREIKTQTENATRTSRGQVDGRINWTRTFTERYSRNPRDSSLFVVENRSESYDVPENLVLKQLLAVVYDTLTECQEYLEAEYEWVTDRWKQNLDLVDELVDIFERNVHVTRIRDPAEYEPTPRMLQRAAESRSPMYREAANLLQQYRSTLAGDRDAIRKLLDETAITPDDDETLLELFVLFKYIAAIEKMRGEEFRLRTIESGKQEVARIAGEGSEDDIVIYHDNAAGDRGVSFDSSPTGDPSDFSRHERIQHESVQTARNYFKNDDLGAATGRPDVIVIEAHRENRREYLITEIKDSSRQETVRRGIEETLVYLALIREDTEFVYEEDSDFMGNGWNGVLVVQDIESPETASFEEQKPQPIRILQAGEVEERLEAVLENFI